MAITQAIETIDSKLSTISVTTGQVIYVRDTQQLYFDSYTGFRYRVADIIVVQTNVDRLAIVAPLINRLYLVVATYEIWIYNGTSWKRPVTSIVTTFTQSYASTAWQFGTAPFMFTILASTHGCGVFPSVEVYDSSGNIITVGISVDASGNVTLTSNVKIAIKVKIS